MHNQNLRKVVNIKQPWKIRRGLSYDKYIMKRGERRAGFSIVKQNIADALF